MRNTNYFFSGLIFLLIIFAFIFLKDNLFFNHDQKKLVNISLADITQNLTSPINISPVIIPSTQIIYNYYYELDGCTETTTEPAPYFLIGLDSKQLQERLQDWNIKKFSREQVILQKNISDKSNQHYILSIKDGYIAVYYQEPINGINLKEITNIPIESLISEDKQRLEAGIKICGEDKLISILQDYES